MANWNWKCLFKWMHLIQRVSQSPWMAFGEHAFPSSPSWTWAGLWFILTKRIQQKCCNARLGPKSSEIAFAFVLWGNLIYSVRSLAIPSWGERDALRPQGEREGGSQPSKVPTESQPCNCPCGGIRQEIEPSWTFKCSQYPDWLQILQQPWPAHRVEGDN